MNGKTLIGKATKAIKTKIPIAYDLKKFICQGHQYELVLKSEHQGKPY